MTTVGSAKSTEIPMPRLQFSTLRSPSTRFSPSIGRITLPRDNSNDLVVDTPGTLTSTNRGVVPHLTRDHVALSSCIKWVHVPFETFLERDPPVPMQLPDGTSFRAFLGFNENRHIFSMTLRDPWYWKELPANGNGYVSAHCIRGVRKVSPAQYRHYVSKMQPDIVIALPDIPYTTPPYSQKRITKSIEKTVSWLTDILQAPSSSTQDTVLPPNTGGKIKKSNEIPMDMTSYLRPSNVFVHLAGDNSEAARRAFADSITEKLHSSEADAISPLKRLDDGVAGYIVDLLPLRKSLLAVSNDDDSSEADSSGSVDFVTHPHSDELLPSISSLLHASLESLPPTKPRIVTGTQSPHEVLQLIKTVGIDMFDTRWAQRAADWGIALDFDLLSIPSSDDGKNRLPRLREDGLRDIGHNLYDPRYVTDFSGFSSNNARCSCFACSPEHPSSQLSHSTVDSHTTHSYPPTEPFSRAYIHHLLHTHEMSAHTLLVGHNLAVLDSFFAAIRSILGDCSNSSTPSEDRFASTAESFCTTYDRRLRLFKEAKKDWADVEYARGKGRLAREKARMVSPEAVPSANAIVEHDAREPLGFSAADSLEADAEADRSTRVTEL